MAGHSKWANIRFRKGAQDAKRSKLFTKFIREITSAVREKGSDPDSNPRLRSAIDKALSGNMTRDAVERAIKRGDKSDDAEQMLEIMYEGYGIAGVAVLVQCLTDNKNRTVAEVRHAFSKHGGNLGTDGSVNYLFEKVGQIIYTDIDEETLLDAALEAGATDVLTEADALEVRTAPEDFLTVKEALLEQLEQKPVASQVNYVPANTVALDASSAESFLKMVDRLEDLDDVQEVYSNADIPSEILESLS